MTYKLKTLNVFMSAWKCFIVELLVYFNLIKIILIKLLCIVLLFYFPFYCHCSFTIVMFHVCLLSCKMHLHYYYIYTLLLMYSIFHIFLIIFVLPDATVLSRSYFLHMYFLSMYYESDVMLYCAGSSFLEMG